MRTGHYKRKDGRWESYIIYQDPDTGEEIKKSFYGRAKYGSDSKRKLNAFIEKLEAGDYSDIRKVTVEAWLNKFLKVYCAGRAQTTLDGYQNYINNHIIPTLGKLKLAELKPLHIQQFYNQEREKGYNEKTILQEHRILHRAFKKAVGDGLMARNPCDAVDAPSPEEYKPTIYTEKQYVALLNALRGHRMEAIILLAGMCGLRRGELLGLTWEDIDLENAVVHVRNTLVPTSKGNIIKGPKSKTSNRDVAIPSSIILRLKQLRGIGKLFTKSNGQDYNPSTVSRLFKEFLKRNGLPHIRLHDLRHFNGTMMLRYGVTEREASARLGHSNLLMTKKYQHVVKEMDKQSADKLNGILKIHCQKQVQPSP
ncbi:MAG TPA: site-specific integrase [Bacillota bacterium]|nr:site-specific integrase [Bacillota bacterium]